MKHLSCSMIILLLASMSLGAPASSHNATSMSAPVSACCHQAPGQLMSCVALASLSLLPQQMACSLIATSLILPFEIYTPPPRKPPIPASMDRTRS